MSTVLLIQIMEFVCYIHANLIQLWTDTIFDSNPFPSSSSSLIHSPNHPLTLPPNHPPNHSLTHALSHVGGLKAENAQLYLQVDQAMEQCETAKVEVRTYIRAVCCVFGTLISFHCRRTSEVLNTCTSFSTYFNVIRYHNDPY